MGKHKEAFVEQFGRQPSADELADFKQQRKAAKVADTTPSRSPNFIIVRFHRIVKKHEVNDEDKTDGTPAAPMDCAAGGGQLRGESEGLLSVAWQRCVCGCNGK